MDQVKAAVMKNEFSPQTGETGPDSKEGTSGKGGLPLQGEHASFNRGYTSEKISFNRKMVAASAAVTGRKSTIHSLCETDITVPRRMMREHRERTGEKLSFTAYIVYCLARVIKEHPQLNAFRRGNRLITLDDVTVSVLVEREFSGERVPEPLAVEGAQRLTFREINDRIRSAKDRKDSSLGGFSGMTWIQYIPGFLLKTFVRLADRNIRLAKRYGKVAVTAVGMFSREPVWFIPHGSGTVLITVGSIEKRMVFNGERHEEREFLCLTGSFDHDIVDGAPAARFMNQFLETLKSGMGLNGGAFMPDDPEEVVQ
jgi:pyruvate/2-oxoglutarate dehydrogenase complex dihydrolipoamide acyltransferase (E2) component